MNKSPALDHFDKVTAALDGMEAESIDTIMSALMAYTPWQPTFPASDGRPAKDEDGFELHPASGSEAFDYKNFQTMQNKCWTLFHTNPFVFTTLMDNVGRITGYGFGQFSLIPKLQELIDLIWEDPRNNLIIHWKKYVARTEIQGELFLVLSLHQNGFVEVDFMSPSNIRGFEDSSGIFNHPSKAQFPLIYRIERQTNVEEFIPSINLAYYPDLWSEVENSAHPKIDKAKIIGRNNSAKFKKLKGYTKFIIQWDNGVLTKRNVGRVKTALEWIEHYSDLKKWEMDHKKSSGAYLWVVTIEDKAAFRMWLAMTDEERKKTGLMAKKTPGGTLLLPPGFSLECKNPKLSSITDQDHDILRMVSAGLNTAEDVMTGSSSGTTFSGAKLSRGPMADRTQDTIADIERFLIFTFWRAVFFLNASVTSMPLMHKMKKVYRFDDKEPKSKKVDVASHKLVEIDFPTSELSDLEQRAKALLGVKHGSVIDVLGIPPSVVARKLGFGGYSSLRLQLATEEMTYPGLLPSMEVPEQIDQESGKKSAKPPQTDTDEEEEADNDE